MVCAWSPMRWELLEELDTGMASNGIPEAIYLHRSTNGHPGGLQAVSGQRWGLGRTWEDLLGGSGGVPKQHFLQAGIVGRQKNVRHPTRLPRPHLQSLQLALGLLLELHG